MRFTTEALVIRETSIGESDRLITLLTREMGVIRAYAAGAKSIKSKKGAATGLLAYSSFTLHKKNDTYRVAEASPIKIFFGAGADVVRLTLAQYFCELASFIVPAQVASEEYLRLILNSLHFLVVENREPSLIKAITELRMAVLAGYSPSLVACEGCGKFEDDIMFFGLRDGQLYCKDCKTNGELTVPLEPTVLSAMRHIVFSKFGSLYSFTVPDEAAHRLSDITGRYVTVQTEHTYNALNFYNTLYFPK